MVPVGRFFFLIRLAEENEGGNSTSEEN